MAVILRTPSHIDVRLDIMMATTRIAATHEDPIFEGRRHWVQSLGSRYWAQISTTDCTITIPLTMTQVHLMNSRRLSAQRVKENHDAKGMKASKKSKGNASTGDSRGVDQSMQEEKHFKGKQDAKSYNYKHDINPEENRGALNVEAQAHRTLSNTTSSESDMPIYDLTMTFESHAIYLMQSGLIARLFSDSRLTEHDRLADLRNSPLINTPFANRPRITTGPWLSKHILYLPVPDPTCFSHILHYLYHGTLDSILNALQADQIIWQGIMANVDFLELEGSIQEDLYQAYRRKQ